MNDDRTIIILLRRNPGAEQKRIIASIDPRGVGGQERKSRERGGADPARLRGVAGCWYSALGPSMTITDSDAARRDIEARSAPLIEWPAVLARLAACAVTPAGKERCLNLAGSDDRATVEGWYAEVREWLTLRDQAGGLPPAARAGAPPAPGA